MDLMCSSVRVDTEYCVSSPVYDFLLFFLYLYTGGRKNIFSMASSWKEEKYFTSEWKGQEGSDA